jgi:hypothetical protein
MTVATKFSYVSLIGTLALLSLTAAEADHQHRLGRIQATEHTTSQETAVGLKSQDSCGPLNNSQQMPRQKPESKPLAGRQCS